MNILAMLLGVPNWVKIAAGVLVLILGLITLHRCSVSDAVKADRKAAQAEVTEKALSAERAANSADATRQAEIQANDATTRKAMNDAVAKNPETVPAGPVSRAVADSLRRKASGSTADR